MSTTTIVLRARAFSDKGPRLYRCTVDGDGTVRVWDSVAGHYTTCHRLSPSAVRRVRSRARLVAAHG